MDQVMLKDQAHCGPGLPGEESWHQARPVILWNYHAKGAAYNDQASFAAVFNSVNIKVDTIFVGATDRSRRVQPGHRAADLCGLAAGGALRRAQEFVEQGGNLITDGKNDLAEELGVKFSDGSSVSARCGTGISLKNVSPGATPSWRGGLTRRCGRSVLPRRGERGTAWRPGRNWGRER